MYKNEFKIIFDYAKDKTDDIEILLSAGNSFSIRINEQNIESFSYADSKGLSVRVIKDGKTGYAYTEKFDEEAFKLIVDEALENAKYTEDDEVAIMENHPDIDVELKMYDEKLNEVDVKDKISFAKDLEKYAKAADKRVFNVPYAVYGDSTGYVKIANSKGLDKEEKQNSAFSYVGALTQLDDDKRMGVEFNVGRDFSK
ncbi:MAG: hypothetical protein DRI23_08785, partial [Candidatus Cloacimonadota bacterium]